jgi:hypothetical protein
MCEGESDRLAFSGSLNNRQYISLTPRIAPLTLTLFAASGIAQRRQLVSISMSGQQQNADRCAR